ncbi:class II aldolase/adducin family protein [Symbioplanes lichenis]|uniref:class II aldolase/adducin family protein n=1 Tax=Symbioplanes lichenis TaxID=1629072 RepID=UPI002739F59C|nr:class II aldolase/adducin family protein [Actinoplanes lichenis]
MDPTGDETSHRDALVAAAGAVAASRILSLSGHGNVSIRPGDGNVVYYTAAPSLRDFPPEAVVRLELSGRVLDGTLPPLSAAAVDMHLTVYRYRPDVHCVIHTHSPAATTFAVAGRPIRAWAEPLVIFGMDDGIPVVPYARRGTPAAAEHIRAALRPGLSAILLENHGVLTFHETVKQALHTAVLVEEAAQLGLGAAALGGPKDISG